MERPKWLEGKDGNIYSQFGEDGLIAAILDTVGVTNRWCFEFGAADGAYLSNTRALRDKGWASVLLEANKDLADHGVNCNVHHAEVTPDNVDDLLLGWGCPPVPDFGSIDIDGQDYWVWKAMERVRPRVVCVEFRWTPLLGILGVPELGKPGNQATYGSILTLGMQKNYVPVARTCVNLLFVDKPILEELGMMEA